MQNIQCILETEAIFSDNNQHRYLLKKTWDKDKKIISVITCYPNLEGTQKLDLTTQLILNKVSEMKDFGSINFVNLYSNMITTTNIKHIENSHDKHTDIQIMKSVKESDEVILAWGSYAKKPVVEARVNEILEMLKPHKKKVKQLINPETNKIMHPLNPKARSKWIFKKH
ncbi:DUF1643 domain-containing protein [Staphylococcus saprophyticus]|jgi:hypothetical protein|uniref:DUF1643 domain-containing protein n=1 Tax=Staphylococcus saprophyticus TaxID=29385 RepID=UPI0016430785|nr:DUF1643 domain-containing protein [Staphylococcus saprophyticus]MBC2920300.1 DUF1643 domain-containing protein [Staphylococcus saprophyticus]MBC2958263.1 DUF1643 domain-containing protein [Staphylococcus saprophyticus]MBC3008289.1 DUF1643 domain-containing protein [Staphylococcus saprophyticus]MBC3022620.1 DUF1643 domain-containing protein [Staphylococcus saprophyticus]MBC3031248.1 DUF1643 domain-containing protein [Staphylococcus saprophyticus]